MTGSIEGGQQRGLLIGKTNKSLRGLLTGRIWNKQQSPCIFGKGNWLEMVTFAGKKGRSRNSINNRQSGVSSPVNGGITENGAGRRSKEEEKRKLVWQGRLKI